MKSLLLGFVEMGIVLDRDERKEATSKEDQQSFHRKLALGYRHDGKSGRSFDRHP